MDLNFLSYVLRSKRSPVQIGAGVVSNIIWIFNLLHGLFRVGLVGFFDHESKYCGSD